MKVVVPNGDTKIMVQVYESADKRRTHSTIPLVLVMGLSGVKEDWGRAPLQLCRARNVYTMDNRGVGETLGPPARTIADFVADVRQVLDHFQLTRVHLLGLSMGGAIAQNFALAHPRRVASLILVATSPSFAPPPPPPPPPPRADSNNSDGSVRTDTLLQVMAKAQAMPAETSTIERMRPVFEINFTPRWVVENSREFEEYLVAFAVTRRPNRGIWSQVKACSDHDVTQRASQLRTTRTLIMHGAKDVVLPVEKARWMAKHYEPTTYVEFEEGGHLLHLMYPSIFEKVVNSFLHSSKL